MKNGNWYKYEGNPVMGGKETGTCYDVDVRFEDGLYKMNFTWRPHRSIAQTESPDGIHWSPFETLLSPRLDSGWEDAVSRSCIITENTGCGTPAWLAATPGSVLQKAMTDTASNVTPWNPF